MSPTRFQDWEQALINKALENGATVPESIYTRPCGIPVIACAAMPDDRIILTDPQNLIIVNTYDIRIRKTDSDKESIMQDKRFYVIHLDADPIIEELDATAIITGIGVAPPVNP